MILSASSISEFLRCRRRWAYGHLYRLPQPQSMPAAIGTAVHAGVEAYHKGAESPLDALRATLASQVAQVPPDEVAADPDAPADAETMLGVYLLDVAPTWHPTMVERKFAFEWEGVTVTGIIDAADETIDEVRDVKTTAGKTINGRKPRFDPTNYDLQLGIYSLGYESLTGRPPRKMQLDVLTRRGTYRDYERKPSVHEALDMVGIVRDAIEHGEYDATGALNGQCNWCHFANGVCPDARP